MTTPRAVRRGAVDRLTSPEAVLRALADPQRRRIMQLVRTGELAAGQIAAYFPITQQAVSQHLRVLTSAGLLGERRQGTRRLYQLRPESLEPVRTVLIELWPDAFGRLKPTVEADKRTAVQHG